MPSRRVLLAVALLALGSGSSGVAAPDRVPEIDASRVPSIAASGLRIELTARAEALWRFAPTSAAAAHDFAAPELSLDGRRTRALPVRFERVGEPIPLGPEVLEHRFGGVLRDDPSLSLELRFRLSDLSPFVRFQYVLVATRPHVFSRSGLEDELSYLATSFAGLPRVSEVQLSGLVERLHGDALSERPISAGDFDAGLGVMGPILIASDGRRTLLLAYEHGSQAGDALLRFDLGRGRSVRLRAVKGNYVRGELLDERHPFETVWLQAGLVAGDETRTAEAYRRFVASELAPEAAVAPHLRYDSHLAPTSAARVLQEIEVAHRLGVETFVLDEGWAAGLGDRTVGRDRIPEGLAEVRQKLDAYGMTLGLRRDPGVREGHRMCLVSRWGETFLQQLVRLAQQTGVRSFEWSAADPYGCDAPGHGHGAEVNTPAERRDSRAFQLPLRLAALARRLAEQVPGAVVDFDVGKGSGVGLALLTGGRERSWTTRSTYGYDRWIPSQVFLAYGFSDDPEASQRIDVATLILGQGGLSCDLLGVPAESVTRTARLLGLWRQVRDAIAAASPVREVVGSGEVHEKIEHESGRGAIVVFSTAAGRTRYVSEHPVVAEHWSTPDTTVTRDAAGHAVLDVSFDEPGAAIVLFGIHERPPGP